VVSNKSSGRIITITIFASTNEAVCHEVQTDFGSFLRASYIKKLWAHVLDFSVQNEAVCCEVQTHFRSFRFARYVKEVLGVFSRFLRPKMKLFPAKFRRILEVFTLRGI